MSRTRKILIPVLCLIIIVAVIMLIPNLNNWMKKTVINGSFSARNNENEMNTVYLNGEPYLPREGVKNYLLIGLDVYGKAESNGSFYNTKQADFITVVSVDSKNETCSFLQINRDTMTTVDQLGFGGVKYGTNYEQIALSHTYGDGMTNSCRNTSKAVSGLLHGVKIDYYVSMTMDAIQLINDYIGGVTVTLDDDYTDIDPKYLKGTTVTLTGEASTAFVRARQDVSDQTNVSRMVRQRLYIDAFMDKIESKRNESDSYWINAYSEIKEYLVTNCSVGDFGRLMNTASKYKLNKVVTPDGESRIGNGVMEYYVDEEKLQTLLSDVFFERRK